MSFERIFKTESGRIIAGLVRVLGSLDRAEDAFHDACVRALETWPTQGVPDQPGAWLTTTARHLAFDRLRRATKDPATAPLDEGLAAGVAPRDDDERLDSGLDDDLLRLLFTCCHPALSPQSQIALTLRTLGGLTTTEIARAFHEPEATTAQRLVRAKAKIAGAGIPWRVPTRAELPERLESVRTAVYLIFNEGYSATEGPALIRVDLCDEAVRLGRWLASVFPDDAEVLGLLALMRLHDARRRARVDAAGELVLLEDQDRSLWDRAAIDEGTAALERALSLRTPGPSQLQAAIAALHAQAPSFEATDWAQIALLYDGLLTHLPTATVALNRAVAVGMAHGPAAGLDALSGVAADELEPSHLYESVRAEFHRRAGNAVEARLAYEAALARVRTDAERRFLERRLALVR